MQGRIALIRYRKSGHFDLGFVMLYLPSPRGPDARCLYDGLLTWTEETLAIIGSRCRTVGMTDANTRLGSVPLQTDHGEIFWLEQMMQQQRVTTQEDSVHFFKQQTYRQSIRFGLEQVVIRGREDYDYDIALICLAQPSVRAEDYASPSFVFRCLPLTACRNASLDGSCPFFGIFCYFFLL